MGGVLTVGDIPGHVVAAPGVDHQREVLPNATHGGGQAGDVPTPHLIRARGPEPWHFARLLWWPCSTTPMNLVVGMEHPVKAALKAVAAGFSIGVIQAAIRQDRHGLPGGHAANTGSLQVSKIRCRSSSLRRWATWRWLLLGRSMPSLWPANCRRQRFNMGRPKPSRNGSSWERTPSAMQSSKICRSF